MSVHTDAAPEDEPRPSLGHVAIGAPLRTNRRLEEVLAAGFAKMQRLSGANTAMLQQDDAPTPDAVLQQGETSGEKHKREDDLPMRNVKSSAPNRKNIYQIEHTQKRILTPFSILEDHPPAQIENDDQDWSAIKTRALEDLGEHFNTNIIDPETKEDIMKQVSDIINDPNSWTRQSADALRRRARDVKIEPKYARQLVESVKQVVGVDKYKRRVPWSPDLTYQFYNRNNVHISSYLLMKNHDFFQDLIEKYNQIEPSHDTDYDYTIHYRFDTTNIANAAMWHMDIMGNRREYGHEGPGSEYNFFPDSVGWSVAFCYDADLNPYECGSEVLLGVPTLKPLAMYQLSHVSGGKFSREQLVQMWGADRHIDQEKGEEQEQQWRRSAWQMCAHVMQNSAEEEMKNWTDDQLFATGKYQLHKVYNHHLHNYINFYFHRSDDTAVDTTKGQVRTFCSISQSAGVAKKTYVPSNFRLSTGEDVTAWIAFN